MTTDIQTTATIVLQKRDAMAFQRAVTSAAKGHEITVLSKDKAFEFASGPVEPSAFQAILLKSLSDQEINADICVQNSANRKKKLLICDMDSTLIGQECIDELADFARVKDRVSAITEQAMRGEIGFEGALKKRVRLLKGLSTKALKTCFDERIRLNPGARTLAQTMSANGAKTVIVSGGFTFFTSRIAIDAGFDEHQANILIEDNGRLTGEVGDPILGREAKFTALKAHSADIGGPDAALAIGDGANDLAMITAAGLGIAFYAKPAVAAAAHCAINHTDLTTALYYQGYTEAEFKT